MVQDDAVMAAEVLRGFLLEHAAVEVWEQGQRVGTVGGERSGYAVSGEAGRLVWHCWSADANLVRRVVGVVSGGEGRLRLQCLRLGQRQPTTMLLKAAAAAGGDGEGLRRAEFRRAVVGAAERDWRGWRCVPGQSGPGAGRSGVQRLVFQRQRALVACVAVDAAESAATVAGALAQALAWSEQVRQRWPRGVVAAVRLVLPEGAEAAVAELRPHLRERPAVECFRLDRSAGRLEAAEAEACGNRENRLRRAPGGEARLEAEAAGLLGEIRELCPQATWETGADGCGRVRHCGLEMVREARGAAAGMAPFFFGCGREQSPLTAATRPLFQQFVREVAEQRVPGQDRRHAYYALQPERWMEHVLRRDPQCLDVQVDPRFVYGQAELTEAGERERVDLLAVDREGRLLVWELKADEDLGFPLQGLEYWRRVRQHQLAGDFERLGYFPGVRLSPLPPRLWLVAPALRWHPLTEMVTRWLAPEVPWTRWGINEEWRGGMQVVYRQQAEAAA